jgi:hypothetical protein
MFTRPSFRWLPSVLALLAAGSAAAQTPPTYAVQFLGPADGVATLTETGVAVGQATVAGFTRGYVASATGGYQLLPLAAGDKSSWALDASEAGVVVGAVSGSLSPEFGGRAVKWLPDGAGGFTVHELGKLPGHIGSVATAVNNLGDIVGYSKTGMFRYPVLFSAPGGVLDLNPLGVFDPQSINDARVFVDKQGKRMDLDTFAVESLGLPPGPTSYQAVTGYAINEHGHVAGTAVLATSTGCVYQAARFVDGPGWQLLSPCSGLANAFDINDLGDVIYQWALIDPILHLEGLGEFGVQQLLQPADQDWDVLAFAMDINSSRQLAVVAQDKDSGQVGAVLLTPTWTCQANLGYGGPGMSSLTVCGGDLAAGTSADLTLSGVPSFGLAFLVAGLSEAPTPLKGGVLVPVPFQLLLPVVAGPAGTTIEAAIPGGGGPLEVFVQAVHLDAELPGGWGFSNAVRLDVLP